MNKFYLVAALSFMLASCCENAKTAKCTDNVCNGKNETIETILSRTSVRSYKPEQVSKEKLDTVLLAALNAPSAMNQQNWEIRVVQNKELLVEMNKGYIDYIKSIPNHPSTTKVDEPDFNVFHGAPTVILVAVEKETAFGAVNGSLLAENAVLAAKAVGLGTCIVGSGAKFLMSESGKASLAKIDVPENYELLLGITLGYPNETPDKKPRDESKIKIIE